MRTAFYALAIPTLLLIPSARAGDETSQVYLSLNSLYGTAQDRQHIKDFGAAWEMPVGRNFTAVARARYLWVKQDDWDEEERKDNVYANGFPATYTIIGFQAALRRHPWEWMPGFFAEALLGYKQILGAYPDAAQAMAMDGWSRGPDTQSFANHALETAVGFGYLWEMRRLRVALGFAFGPEFLFRNSVLADGARESSSEVLDLLHFNQLEIGYAF
jgi:hypothetical protein